MMCMEMKFISTVFIENSIKIVASCQLTVSYTPSMLRDAPFVSPKYPRMREAQRMTHRLQSN